MITTLKPETTEEQRIQLIQWFEAQGVQVHEFIGAYQTVLGLIGDTSGIDVEMLELLDIVEKVTLISDPFKSAQSRSEKWQKASRLPEPPCSEAAPSNRELPPTTSRV